MKELEVKVIERLFNINKKAFNNSDDYGIDPAILIAIIGLLAQLMPYLIDWLSSDRWFAKIRMRSIVKKELAIDKNKFGNYFSPNELSDTIYQVYQENKELASEYNVAN